MAALRAKLAQVAPTPQQEAKVQEQVTVESLSEDISLTLVQKQITSLGEAIHNEHPTMPSLLREIHTALSKQPHNVTLLSEVEISTIVSGLMKVTKQTVTTKAIKSATSGSKKKLISLDDI